MQDSSVICGSDGIEGGVVCESNKANDTGCKTTTALIWENTIRELRQELDGQVYLAYIAPLSCHSFNADTSEFVISAPSTFLRNHVDKNLSGKIAGALKKSSLLNDLRVRFIVGSDTNQPANEDGERIPSLPYVVVKKVKGGIPQRSQEKTSSAGNQLSLSYSLNPRYTFSNFVVGSSNQFGHAAATRVAELPGKSYNPLFIYGGVGLGKTHLLHAIGNAVHQANPKANVLYISSEAFTNELILALRNAKMEEFKRRMRAIDVLLIDDIQFICGKERTQEEFFHTFNALYNAKHQIVLTSDKLPSDIPGIEERLQTRFSWGLTADLQAPDFETRVAILKRKASVESFVLPSEVANYIAENISSNVRELEGALTRLYAISSLQNHPITYELAQSALKPLLQPRVVNVSTEDIKKAVANHFSIKVSDIISKRRTKNLSFPRHIAMYLCRKHTTCSYPEIGSQFGNRDHSSVIHAASVVAGKIKSDSEVKSLVAEIERIIFQ